MRGNGLTRAHPLPAAWQDRARAVAPVLLLLAIAALGVYRTATLQQSSWQGASFGMFATYDNISSRTVAAYAVSADGRERIAVPGDLHGAVTRLCVVPTESAADALAHRLLVHARGDVTTVEVEVRRVVLERDGGLLLRIEPITTGTAAR